MRADYLLPAGAHVQDLHSALQGAADQVLGLAHGADGRPSSAAVSAVPAVVVSAPAGVDPLIYTRRL